MVPTCAKTTLFPGFRILGFNATSPVLASPIELSGVDTALFLSIMQNGNAYIPSQLAKLQSVSSEVIKRIDRDYRTAITTYVDRCSSALFEDDKIRGALTLIDPKKLIEEVNVLPNMGVVQHVQEAFWAFLRYFADIGPSSLVLAAVKMYIDCQGSMHRIVCLRQICKEEEQRLANAKNSLTEKSKTLVEQLNALQSVKADSAKIKNEIREVSAVFSAMFSGERLLIDEIPLDERL